MPTIELQQMQKVFKGKKRQLVEALKGLTLTIEDGEVFGFLGPNGAGKSTTIKCLMGLIRPTSGKAYLMGEEAGNARSRLNVGYLPENPAFYDYLTAEEYLKFVGKTFNMPQTLLQRRIDDTLKQLELWEARMRPIRGYSKGMVQRVGLAQTMIHDPQVYILDEPMSGLDPIGRALVKEIIIDLKKRGKCIFFSTHITDDVEKVCDRVGVIVKGNMVAVDRVESILREGVEGYAVQLHFASTPQPVPGGTLVRSDVNTVEYYIPRAGISAFMGEASRLGGGVVSIETKRRDLEDFFLTLVRQNSEV